MPIPTFRLWLLLLLTLLAGRTQAQRLAAGYRHTLSIHADGTLWAWGANSYGQLGIGNTTPQNSPVQVGTATDWQSVQAGYFSTLALKTDGTLWAWGRNLDGQLGQGTTTGQQNQPVQVGTATTWASIGVGDYHALAIKADGTLWAWGRNLNGQLGLGNTNTAVSTPTQVGTAAWRAVSAGAGYTLALKADGTLWSWGGNGNAQLGNGSTSITNQPTPAQVGTAATWQSISAGALHALALQADGTLWAWGNNGYGQLGTATAQFNQPTPIQVGTATTWRGLSAGYSHSAAVRQDGSLWTWGDNSYGQLGDGTTTQQNVPVQVATEASWQTVRAGQYYTTALRQDNSYWAWGYHSYGQLGNGRSAQLVPYQLPEPATWRSVSAGPYYSLAIRPDGTLWGWGQNTTGQLGLGSTTSQRQPAQVGTATNWASASASYVHAAAVRQDGTLWTWGDNSNGQLGDGTTTAHLRPAQVGTATDWASVSTGYYYTLALKTDGSLWAWGRGAEGQLGLGTTTQQNTPVRVGTATWQRIATSKSALNVSVSLGIQANGTLWAWGDNRYYQLGTGTTTTQQAAPVQVGTATWQSMAAGNMHTLAVRADGTLWAWGYNSFGQLGTGTGIGTTQPTPVQVGTSASWRSVTAGYTSSAALDNQGTLYTWGGNLEGQLGTGTTTDQPTPQPLSGNLQWQSVSMGFYHVVALQANASGTLWTWGDNRYTQLTLPNSTPLPTYVPSGGTPLAVASATAATTSWSLAPNPAHGRARLLGLPAGPVAGQLFDAQGRLVRTTTAAEVELTGLAPGLYLLRAAASGTIRTLRLAVE